MSYNYSANGRLSYVHSYRPPRARDYVEQAYVSRNTSQQASFRSEAANKHSMYANSQNHVEPGHFVSFSNLQTETSVPELATVEATTDHKHVAGVVIENAAGPTDTTYTNKNGIHSLHSISNHQNILRVAMPGSRVDAWVVDEHENAFEGVYEKTINGTVVGQVVIKNIDDEYFSIESFGSNDNLASEVAELRAKLEALTSN